MLKIETAMPARLADIRRFRRTAWRLVALCMLLRVGDALSHEILVQPAGKAALAED